jgi:hypothetical protein
MKEKGMNISNLITQIRTLCKETAALLQTTDRLVEKDGWSAISGSTVTSGNSGSLYDPVGWVPELFYRYYTNSEEYPNKLLYVAVILDNRNDNPVYPPKNKELFEEPILTAGYFNYGKKVVEGNVWPAEYCKAHFFSDDEEYNGEIWSVEPEKMICITQQTRDKKLVEFASPLSLRSLALPLIDITDTPKIEKSVIDPLFRDMIQS